MREVFESENFHASTKLLRIILDYKYKKSHLNKVMKNKCHNLIKEQQKDLLNLLQKIEYF